MATDMRQDRDEIEQLLYRYAWMVDRRDWKRMDEVFAAGATIDYTSTGGQKGAYRETLAWLARALAPWPANLHFISNLHVEIDGDRARSRCYFLAPMARPRSDGSHEVITTAGLYLDELVRTPGGWRIAARDCQQALTIGALPAGYAIPQ
jgi:3-phenylpropionate/cinnamic acid dioxygenase small subunit